YSITVSSHSNLSICFFFSFFFFYPSRPLRHLHSFPTRRSSDLSASFLEKLKAIDPRIRALPPLGRAEDFDSLSARLKPYAVDARDRKSTRLNSSHVKISYAVFCLKKKKKNKIR